MVMAMGAASAHSSQSEAANGALPVPARASVAHLKVKGTATVASLAASSSTMAPITRSFSSRRSDGQIYGHRWITVANSAPRLADTLGCGSGGRWW